MARLGDFVNYACGFVDYDTKTINDLPQLYEDLVAVCDSYQRITDYYFLAHTEKEVLHIHFAFYLKSQTRLLTILNKMNNILLYKKADIRSLEAITISKCDSLNATLRYFLHQDEKSIKDNKPRYELDDFVSNVDKDIIQGLVNSRKGEIDAYYLRDCVLDTVDEFELMNKLGLKVYHKYRFEIQTLKEMRASLLLRREEERENHIQEDFTNSID